MLSKTTTAAVAEVWIRSTTVGQVWPKLGLGSVVRREPGLRSAFAPRRPARCSSQPLKAISRL